MLGSHLKHCEMYKANDTDARESVQCKYDSDDYDGGIKLENTVASEALQVDHHYEDSSIIGPEGLVLSSNSTRSINISKIGKRDGNTLNAMNEIAAVDFITTHAEECFAANFSSSQMHSSDNDVRILHATLLFSTQKNLQLRLNTLCLCCVVLGYVYDISFIK